MQFMLILLASMLALAAAKPYGVKGGHDREAVQSHIPVNEDLRLERFETSRTEGRKGGAVRPRPQEGLYDGYSDGRLEGRTDGYIQRRPQGGYSRGQGDYIGGQDSIAQGRPIGQESAFQGRPYGSHSHGDAIEDRPVGQNIYGSGLIDGRTLPGGYRSQIETEELGQGRFNAGQTGGGVKSGQRRISY